MNLTVIFLLSPNSLDNILTEMATQCAIYNCDPLLLQRIRGTDDNGQAEYSLMGDGRSVVNVVAEMKAVSDIVVETVSSRD